MMNATLLEVYVQLREAELRQRRVQPSTPARPVGGPTWRRRLAQRLIGLGLRLDADAARAVAPSIEATPRLNGSDA